MKKRYFFPGLVAVALMAPAAAMADGKFSFWRSPLAQEIREATSAYRDVDAARAAGYAETSCVSGSQGGAMGVHFVRGDLLGDGAFEVTTPEVLVYEPLGDGRMRLVAVEYIILADLWDAANPPPAPGAPAPSPVARGQLFHFAGSPNRYRLPAYYELHVWAWKYNPNGTFADWNPWVSCDAYDPMP